MMKTKLIKRSVMVMAFTIFAIIVFIGQQIHHEHKTTPAGYQITNDAWLYDTNYFGGWAAWKANHPGWESKTFLVTNSLPVFNAPVISLEAGKLGSLQGGYSFVAFLNTNASNMLSIRNLIEPIGHTNWQTGDFYLDWTHATNIEMTSFYEPIVTKTTNGWVIRFKASALSPKPAPVPQCIISYLNYARNGKPSVEPMQTP